MCALGEFELGPERDFELSPDGSGVLVYWESGDFDIQSHWTQVSSLARQAETEGTAEAEKELRCWKWRAIPKELAWWALIAGVVTVLLILLNRL